MTCLEVETIVSFLEGRLDTAGRSRLEVHVAACDDCTERLSLALAGSDRGEPAGAIQRSRPLIPARPRGATVGRYVLLGLIGRGGMGEVYAAYDPELDRKVALKIFRSDVRGQERRDHVRLLGEARAIAKLRHPNVVMVHDAGTADGEVFLAMEYVEGTTLESWLVERPRRRGDVLDVFVAAGRGLAAAHAAGLVHRDFKPSNVMVSADGMVRVLDFGLARPLRSSDDTMPAASARPGTPVPPRVSLAADSAHAVGTPLYMAPEQFLGQPSGAPADQFSFCVALYEALHGARPFAGATVAELMSAVCAGKIAPSPTRAGVPARIRGVVLRGLRPRPEDRWPSMEALLSALSKSASRSRLALGSAGALALLALVGVAAVARHHRPVVSCDGGPAHWQGIWTLDGASESTSARVAVRSAFLTAGSTNGEAVWARTSQRLDAYVVEWNRIYQDACQATRVRGEQSAEGLDLRMGCLMDRLVRVQALVDVLRQATPSTVANAGMMVDTLPLLDRCSDLSMLRASVKPPEDRATRERVARLARDIARVKALSDAGRCADARVAWHVLVEESRSVGYPPVEATALLSMGTVAASCLSPQEGLSASLRAAEIALNDGDAETAATALIFASADKMNMEVDPDLIMESLDLARALLARLPRRPVVLERWWLGALAGALVRKGDVAGAEAAYRRAISLMEQSPEGNRLDRWAALLNWGVDLQRMNRPADALASYQEAQAQMESVNANHSTNMAILLANAAEALNDLHRPAEALARVQQARAIFEEQNAADYLLGFVWTLEGESLLASGRFDEAFAATKKGLSFLGDSKTGYRGQALFGMARALAALRSEPARVAELAERAADAYKMAGDTARAAQVTDWLRSKKAAEVTAPAGASKAK